jgi:hypothetical protein
MNTCEDCGLPQKVCAALTMYANAFRSYENGDLAAAHKWADDAAAAIAEYKSQRGAPFKKLELSDEERLRLSGFF